jgi:aconitate hydratase
LKGTVSYKILKGHLVSGDLKKGSPVRLKVDQALTQDATGTMVYLQLEAMGVEKIKIPLAVSYVDHNTLQESYLNPDDHVFLQTSAARYGAVFSRPGNGICHQVHLERFGAPGKILIGSDSHTPTGGGIGMIAIGTGGLDVAAAMAGEDFEITAPEIVEVRLKGKLCRPYVTAMDVILELLRRLTVKGGLGKIFEYTGEGVKSLTVPERATITNMGAELGATTSVFPSDGETKKFLRAQKREKDWQELSADAGAKYDSLIEIDLKGVEPMIAQPFSPDSVVPIRQIAGIPVDQVCIGSCTNSSYAALATVANILKGKKVAENTSLAISPGSKQVMTMIAKDGFLSLIIDAGGRVLESVCGPCIGMGQAPKTAAVSVRTFNRNFKGRSGTPDAKVYLCSPVSAAMMALAGKIIDPRDAGMPFDIPGDVPEYMVNDNMFVFPPQDGKSVVVVKGPNIQSIPLKEKLPDRITAEVILKLGDNITTDDIMPAGSKVLPLRSNIPAISQFVFSGIDKTFPERAKKAGSSMIVGAENYGQGSSREHAALAPMYLGVKAVVAKSIARIHRKNLVNCGILPLHFKDKADYDRVSAGDTVAIEGLSALAGGRSELVLDVASEKKKEKVIAVLEISQEEKNMLVYGGYLSYIRSKAGGRDGIR